MLKLKKLYIILLCVVAFGCYGPSLAGASPLDLVLKPFPNIVALNISVYYDSPAEYLTANGSSFLLDNDGVGVPENISGGIFDLTASINDFGELAAGSLSISGIVTGLSFNSGTLLTGTLTDFGFNTIGDPLEFLFDITGGDAAGLYGGVGSKGGIILSNTSFSGSWTDNFSSNNGVSDVGAAVPEPNSLVLIASGLVFLTGVRRKF